MIATIDVAGKLTITPTNQLEGFALCKWKEDYFSNEKDANSFAVLEINGYDDSILGDIPLTDIITDYFNDIDGGSATPSEAFDALRGRIKTKATVNTIMSRLLKKGILSKAGTRYSLTL